MLCPGTRVGDGCSSVRQNRTRLEGLAASSLQSTIPFIAMFSRFPSTGMRATKTIYKKMRFKTARGGERANEKAYGQAVRCSHCRQRNRKMAKQEHVRHRDGCRPHKPCKERSARYAAFQLERQRLVGGEFRCAAVENRAEVRKGARTGGRPGAGSVSPFRYGAVVVKRLTIPSRACGRPYEASSRT